jgi:hypothetical protein
LSELSLSSNQLSDAPSQLAEPFAVGATFARHVTQGEEQRRSLAQETVGLSRQNMSEGFDDSVIPASLAIHHVPSTRAANRQAPVVKETVDQVADAVCGETAIRFAVSACESVQSCTSNLTISVTRRLYESGLNGRVVRRMIEHDGAPTPNGRRASRQALEQRVR